MADVASRADGDGSVADDTAAARLSRAGARPVVYLDHAATSPLRPEVFEAMKPWLLGHYGNPSGGHSVARTARRALDDARDVVAECLGGEPGEVVFTSGGTEADNLAITGALAAARAAGVARPTVACSAIEHPGVLEPTRAAGGAELAVDECGCIDLDNLRCWLGGFGRPDPSHVVEVSVMLVNNETGVIQPVAEVASLVRELAPEALFHTDAVQAMCWMDVATQGAGADLVTVSGHKFGGPKGVGALLVRRSAKKRLQPVLRGGPQEGELRAGTQDVAGIVGMAEAARLAVADRAELSARVGPLARRLVSGVVSKIERTGEAVPRDRRIEAICNIWFDGIESEELLIALDQLGVCASAGSSCASGALDPSHVLMAMGRDEAAARSHVRFSLGPTTTAAEVESAVTSIVAAVDQLRSVRA